MRFPATSTRIANFFISTSPLMGLAFSHYRFIIRTRSSIVHKVAGTQAANRFQTERLPEYRKSWAQSAVLHSSTVIRIYTCSSPKIGPSKHSYSCVRLVLVLFSDESN